MTGLKGGKFYHLNPPTINFTNHQKIIKKTKPLERRHGNGVRPRSPVTPSKARPGKKSRRRRHSDVTTPRSAPRTASALSAGLPELLGRRTTLTRCHRPSVQDSLYVQDSTNEASSMVKPSSLSPVMNGMMQSLKSFLDQMAKYP
jgi:hypothetical protein